MTTYNFDEIIERRGTDSIKWSIYDDDVLPMFVADMDFRSPEPVLRALHERIDHGVFGYAANYKALTEAIIARAARLYNWHIEPDHIIYLPNLVSGIFLASKLAEQPDERVLMQTPVYGPFFMGPQAAERPLDTAPLTLTTRPDNTLYYEVDFDVLEDAITPQTRVLLFCSPHNPVGRVFRRDELERITEICERHNLIICSDEIHADILFDGHQHIPTASLSPEIAARTITLMSVSKTFNLPALGLGWAVIQDEALRERVKKLHGQMGIHTGVMGHVAALAAYTQGQEWLDQLLPYLQANRDFVTAYVRDHLPGVYSTHPEGTYLSWLDFRALDLPDNVTPYQYFLDNARVAMNEGAWFGEEGRGFVRLNFGCPRSTLQTGLDRLCAALESVNSRA